MNKKYYVVSVFGCVEPELSKPYKTPAARNAAARGFYKKRRMEDATFWLDVDEKGIPTIGAFISGELGDE